MKRVLVLFAAASVMLVACNKKQQTEAPKELQSQQPQQQLPAGHPSLGGNTVAGVKWTVPSGWTVGPEKAMRIVTYNIPAAGGDAEGAELGVFHFGSGQGGDVENNIGRWVSQFEDAKGPDRSSKEVNGMKVELVKIAGTYLAPSGPMMQSSGKKTNYR